MCEYRHEEFIHFQYKFQEIFPLCGKQKRNDFSIILENKNCQINPI